MHETRSFFFFNDTATTEIYTLSLHDALPILSPAEQHGSSRCRPGCPPAACVTAKYSGRRANHEASLLEKSRSDVPEPDRKSTRLNSSHSQISYAVFCLKKKK